MKSKNLSLLLLFLAITLNAFPQDKKPEAITDYYSAIADFQYSLHPLNNDIVDEGNTARILTANGTGNAIISFNDSIIFYKPRSFFRGLDSISYRIKDNQNNLISDAGKIYITVTNNGFDTLNINNISAQVNPYGCLFWDYYQMNLYEFPKGSGLSTIFSLGLSLAATDMNQNQYLSGVLHRQFGTDYFPGPVSLSQYYNFAFDTTWTHVWKLSKAEIQQHQDSWDMPDYEMPDNIRTWPGNGDPAKGQAAVLAPYYDKDENGSYNPQSGDYPIIRGDQAVYFIYNDVRAPHTDYNSTGLGAEIHCMLYAFNRPDDAALDNTIFINYLIINRSDIVYDTLDFSVFTDFDIGYASDDFVGCDTILNAAIGYNGNETDINGYGEHPPAQSVMLLNRAMSGFVCSANSSGGAWMTTIGTPEGLLNITDSRWSDGTPIIDNGCGHISCAEGNTTKFAFPGDVADTTAWSMPQIDFTHQDIYGFLNIQSQLNFQPGDAVCIDLALTTAVSDTGNNFDSYHLVKKYASDIRSFYQENFPASCFDVAPLVEEKNIDNKTTVHVSPNPTNGELTIEINALKNNISWQIFDITGRLKSTGEINNERSIINIHALEKGMYILRINNGDVNTSTKVIKK